MDNALLKTIANSNWRYVYFVRPLKYLINKLPVPTKRETELV